MELGETLAGGAARETLEEACATVEMGHQFVSVDVVDAGQVHVFFMNSGAPNPDVPGYLVGGSLLHLLQTTCPRRWWQIATDQRPVIEDDRWRSGQPDILAQHVVPGDG